MGVAGNMFKLMLATSMARPPAVFVFSSMKRTGASDKGEERAAVKLKEAVVCQGTLPFTD